MNLWDAETGRLVRTLNMPHVRRIAFTADGTLMALGDAEGTVHFWSVPPH